MNEIGKYLNYALSFAFIMSTLKFLFYNRAVDVVNKQDVLELLLWSLVQGAGVSLILYWLKHKTG